MYTGKSIIVTAFPLILCDISAVSYALRKGYGFRMVFATELRTRIWVNKSLPISVFPRVKLDFQVRWEGNTFEFEWSAGPVMRWCYSCRCDGWTLWGHWVGQISDVHKHLTCASSKRAFDVGSRMLVIPSKGYKSAFRESDSIYF